MTPTEVDAALRERLAADPPREPAVDVDEVHAAVQRRVVRRRRRHRVATAAAIAALVATTAAVASQAFDDRPAVETGPTTAGTAGAAGGEIDADLLWIGWQEGPTLADPNTGVTTPIAPRPQGGRWCNTCPLVRVGDQAFTTQNGRTYAYTPGDRELRDTGPGDHVFPAADGQSILVAVDDHLEQRTPDGAVLAGPWPIPTGYDLTFPPRATARGVLVESPVDAFTRPLAEWDPATGDVRPMGDHHRLVDTHIEPDATLIARTDCEGDVACWLLLTDTRTGRTTRIESPVRGNGFYGGGAFSPDGRELAVFVATNQGTTNPTARLGLVDTRTGQVRLVEGPDVQIGEPYGYAAWSPSGDWLFFDGLSGTLRALDRGGNRPRELGLAGSYSLVALGRDAEPRTSGAATATTSSP